MRQYCRSHPNLQHRYGDAWQQIEDAQVTYKDIQERWRQLELGRAFWSTYFDYARTLVRGADERAKANPGALARVHRIGVALHRTGPAVHRADLSGLRRR